jgi:hypothetical protein
MMVVSPKNAFYTEGSPFSFFLKIKWVFEKGFYLRGKYFKFQIPNFKVRFG